MASYTKLINTSLSPGTTDLTYECIFRSDLSYKMAMAIYLHLPTIEVWRSINLPKSFKTGSKIIQWEISSSFHQNETGDYNKNISLETLTLCDRKNVSLGSWLSASAGVSHLVSDLRPRSPLPHPGSSTRRVAVSHRDIKRKRKADHSLQAASHSTSHILGD